MSEVLTDMIEDTLASGVEPLGRKYFGVFDGYGDVPIAYVTTTEVFTTASGVLTDYIDAIDKNEIGKRWSISNIKSAAKSIARLKEKDRHPAFITAEVTSSFICGKVKDDLEKLISSGLCSDNICLAIEEKTLVENKDKAAQGISEARSMGFQTAIIGFDGEQSLSLLFGVGCDYVFLSSDWTALALDKNKPGAFTALIGLLHSLRKDVVLCGVVSDEEMREATASECFGIMPGKEYVGQFSFPMEGRGIAEISKDGEGK